MLKGHAHAMLMIFWCLVSAAPAHWGCVEPVKEL